MSRLKSLIAALSMVALAGIAHAGDLLDALDNPSGPAAKRIRDEAFLTSPSRCTTQLCKDHIFDDLWQKANKAILENCDRYADLCADVKAGRR